jgi:hypothetical protein
LRPASRLLRLARRTKGGSRHRTRGTLRALSPSHEASRHSTTCVYVAMSGQVFGLASTSGAGLTPTVHRFPVLRPVLVVEVVLAYRCGAAPDSHRIPMSALTRSEHPDDGEDAESSACCQLGPPPVAPRRRPKGRCHTPSSPQRPIARSAATKARGHGPSSARTAARAPSGVSPCASVRCG